MYDVIPLTAKLLTALSIEDKTRLAFGGERSSFY